MTVSLEELLHVRFEERGVEPTRLAWAEALGKLDKGTFSRILNGALPLTPQRAQKWAKLLYPDDPEQAASFALRLVEAAHQAPPIRNVSDFFEDMVDNRDGVTDAERITELLIALQSDDLQNVLICCEYRDLPRAGPDSRYEYLAKSMGEAIAAGISFAMFQPFGEDIPLPIDNKSDRPALNAAIYMMQIKTKCIDAYKLFRNEALAELAKVNSKKKPDRLKILKEDGDKIDFDEKPIGDIAKKMKRSSDKILISSRLQLYARSPDAYSHLGSGFQGRMFYIRYTTKDDGINHFRIMQWVSTPKKDLLIYRGQSEITPDALRDSFYPIPHFFDSPVGRIPFKIDDKDHGGPGVRRYLKQRPGGEGLPAYVEGVSKSIWDPYD